MSVKRAEMWHFKDNARQIPRTVFPRVGNRFHGILIDQVNFTVFRDAHSFLVA